MTRRTDEVILILRPSSVEAEYVTLSRCNGQKAL